jgi:hypothetical protein
VYGEKELGGRSGKSDLVFGLLVMVLLVIGGVEVDLGQQLEQVKIDQILAHVKNQEKESKARKGAV